MPSISIVIPTYNRKDKLKRLLISLENSTFTDFEIIVVDDCSNDGTELMMKKEFPTIRYIRHESICLVGKSRNDGILASSTNLVFMIDDDNVIDKNTLDILLTYTDKNPNFGVVAPVSCYYDSPDTIMYAGTRYAKWSKKTIRLFSGADKSVLKGKIIEADSFPNSYLLKRDLAINVGLTSPKVPFGGEDGYLQFKIKKTGHELYCVGDSYVYHDMPKVRESIRVSPFRFYYFVRGKITFVKDLFSGSSFLIFAFFLPLYFLWYLFYSINGENKYSCMKAVVQGTFDGLFGHYPLRYL